MDTRIIFFGFLAFQGFLATKGSIVKIRDGGYEDIVIAVHPGVQENDRIIEKIQVMVKEASDYLFNATKKRLFINNVNILIPRTWSNKGNYLKPITETYDKADVIIAKPMKISGDDPYTVQYRGCQEKGEYIHLTPNFLLDDNLISVYGPRGKLFVHEWAHLRWGVFDENNIDVPYYVSSELNAEATRCSIDINGTNRVLQCVGNSSITKACKNDSKTGLYEDECLFFPESKQFAKQSIMYIQALPSVSEFCDESNHNFEAPSLQNRLCNSRSTWNVIMNSPDIIYNAPNYSITKPPDPSFKLLQYKERVIALLLDVSASMVNYDKLQRVSQAVDMFLHQVELGSYIGIIEFSDTATVLSNPVQIKNVSDYEILKSHLPIYATHKSSLLCPGILIAIQMNTMFFSSSNGTEILLVTDSEDPYLNCFDEIKASGVTINVISLGPKAESKLEQIANLTGGLQFFASDKLDSNDLLDAYCALSSGNRDGYQHTIQLESTVADLEPHNCLNGTVLIDESLGTSTLFYITWRISVPSIKLQSPSNKLYTEANFSNDSTLKSSKLPIPGTAEKGEWNYSFCNDGNLTQAIGLIATSKAAGEEGTSLMVTVHTSKEMYNYPEPMIVYASVKLELLPFVELDVKVIIEGDNGTSKDLELWDNGAGADMLKNDGIYSRYITGIEHNGRYNLKVYVESRENMSRVVLPRNRALYVPGYVVDGVILLNPLRPVLSDDDLQVNIGAIKRMTSGESFVITGIPPNPQINYKPNKIYDLMATTVEDRIVLSWTAPGENLDQGQASVYDFRWSTNPTDLRDDFASQHSIDISSTIPKVFGSTETFEFVPDADIVGDGIVFYFALIAINNGNVASDVSNIAQAAIFNLTRDLTTDRPPNSPGNTFTDDFTSPTPDNYYTQTEISYISSVSTDPVDTSSPGYVTSGDDSTSPMSTYSTETIVTITPLGETTSLTRTPSTMTVDDSTGFQSFTTDLTVETSEQDDTSIETTTVFTHYTTSSVTSNSSVSGNTITTTKKKSGKDNTTIVVVIVVCVTVLVICIIICCTIYIVKHKRVVYKVIV